ncbi:hypothetical protein AHiyo6_19240 [Arthrobacter sp. Hiyo6]|jgi:hypothetical protein|nr:hypothetical protein AHiyo6_19240 [Arthrobacter sp. Hiyo6]
MLILFGVRTVLRALPGRATTCRRCGLFVEHLLEERATKFSVFFIPIFTLSKDYRITCTNCGERSALSRRGMKSLSR